MDKFFYEKILDLIFPPKCGYCGEITGTEHFICEDCYNLSTEKYINRCNFCGKISLEGKCFECKNKVLYYDRLFFCSEYTDEFREKIHGYKFLDKKYLYHFFAELIYNKLKDEKFDIIIPVPISRERYRERGYNQSALIANKLSKLLKKEYNPYVLVKIKNSERQSIQNFRDRQKSVKNVFKITDTNIVRGKEVALIDDIFTTGATVNECSKILKEAGAKSIKVAVICISHMLK